MLETTCVSDKFEMSVTDLEWCHHHDGYGFDTFNKSPTKRKKSST